MFLLDVLSNLENPWVSLKELVREDSTVHDTKTFFKIAKETKMRLTIEVNTIRIRVPIGMELSEYP